MAGGSFERQCFAEIAIGLFAQGTLRVIFSQVVLSIIFCQNLQKDLSHKAGIHAGSSERQFFAAIVGRLVTEGLRDSFSWKWWQQASRREILRDSFSHKLWEELSSRKL